MNDQRQEKQEQATPSFLMMRNLTRDLNTSTIFIDRLPGKNSSVLGNGCETLTFNVFKANSAFRIHLK